MAAIETNRDVIVHGNVQVLGQAVFAGGLGVSEPVGVPGQVLTLGSDNSLAWAHEYSRVIVTARAHTASPAHTVIMVGDAGGSVVVTLPPIAEAGERMYRVADLSGMLGPGRTITVAAQGSETIVGAGSFVLSGPYNSATFIHDGTSRWAVF
jgi:hypothetical protein